MPHHRTEPDRKLLRSEGEHDPRLAAVIREERRGEGAVDQDVVVELVVARHEPSSPRMNVAIYQTNASGVGVETKGSCLV